MSKYYDLEVKRDVIHLYNKGYNIIRISKSTGISYDHVRTLISNYKTLGLTSLNRKDRRVYTLEEKRQIVLEAQNSSLSCREIAKKYDTSVRLLYKWLQDVKTGGIDSLRGTDDYNNALHNNAIKRKKSIIMGRPKKKAPETELDKLKLELEYLRTENALLKKMKALVEERDARQRGIGPKSSKN